ncbi:Gypsy retrotransposon integrase-like protein 1 [Elysia marginata]|uniref:Gypsy retrotransposon integrase-like protein 1 n=1 Tax=Elysia marginata TaxID=1093978 RepID=A0AAV4GQ29_9GAST|nr:Gypsy retrotransposon integrase-like protein 1 [Elysia marginata]
MFQDITRFVESCDIWRRHGRRLPKLNLQEFIPATRPFDKVAIDVIGLLLLTDNKHRLALTVPDCLTPWPEFIPLKGISTVDTAKALFSFFTRLGLPKEILLDNAQQLVSKAMTETMLLLAIDRSFFCSAPSPI